MDQWATITELSTRLGVDRDTVYRAVAVAGKRHEAWVKKEPPSSWHSRRPIWLIDTVSDGYRTHASRWAARRGLEETAHLSPWPESRSCAPAERLSAVSSESFPHPEVRREGRFLQVRTPTVEMRGELPFFSLLPGQRYWVEFLRLPLSCELSSGDILRDACVGIGTMMSEQTRPSLRQLDDRRWRVRLGSTIVYLYTDEVRDVCACLDVIGQQYAQALREATDTLQTWDYPQARVLDRVGVRLLSVQPQIWQLLLRAASRKDGTIDGYSCAASPHGAGILILAERKTPSLSYGDGSKSLFGVGKRGDPLPKPKHLTLTPSSGTLVLVSRGVKDSACTAGLAGTHACGGECKSKHEWNRGGQSPRKQEDLPRERRNPLSFRHGEDVNPLLYEYPDWALLSVGASLPRWTHVGAPGYWTATETDAWLRRTFIPQVQALEPTDQLTDPRYRVAQALAPDVFAAWASQRALAPPPLSRGYLPLHLVEQPHALIPYVEVIRHWLADYPAGRIPAMWVQAYYTAIATTASQAHPVICASHAFTRMYEAIGLGTHDCSSGWHMLHASFQEVSTCLWGHVQRVTTMLYEDTTCAELLSELLLLLLAQAGASQYEHMASVRHAIRPLWEQARFDERYVFPAMREQGTGA